MEILLIVPLAPSAFTLVSGHKKDERQSAEVTKWILKSTRVPSCSDGMNTEKHGWGKRENTRWKWWYEAEGRMMGRINGVTLCNSDKPCSFLSHWQLLPSSSICSSHPYLRLSLALRCYLFKSFETSTYKPMWFTISDVTLVDLIDKTNKL